MCGTEERANQQPTRRACVAQLGGGGRRRRRKRTANIQLMSVTLKVSKLSGWLKSTVPCRVQRGHPTEGSAWRGDVAHREGANQHRPRGARVWPCSGVWAERRRREAHIEHVVHVCDAGGVKAQRLVESMQFLPSPKGAPNMSEGNAWRVAQRCGTEGKGESRSTRSVCV